MKRPTIIACLGALAIALSVAGVATAQEPEERLVRVYALKWAEAGALDSALEHAALREGESLTADARTNSLIISATAASHERVQDLLQSLDVEIARPGDDRERVRVFPLSHAVANDRLAESLWSLYGTNRRGGPQSARFTPPLRIANDTETNQIVARGLQHDLDTLHELITALDRKPSDPVSPELRVRLIWLVNGVASSRVRPLPKDLVPVVEELDRIGITDLQLAAQSLVRVRAGEAFGTSFTAQIDDTWSVQVNGTAAGGPGGVRTLSIELSGHSQSPTGNRGPAALTELETTISTRSGHYVVLGVNPIKDMDSVFVIQVSDVP